MSAAFTQTDFITATGCRPETAERFEAWRALLVAWSAKINLVGPSTLEDFWRRHALDSAQLINLVPPAPRTTLDIGSGAGFPGLALALMLADRGRAGHTTLIEASAKRAAFLREAVRAADADNVIVLNAKVEDVDAAPADVITARAFAPLPRLLAAAARFWGEATLGLFPKGRDWRAEVEAAAERQTFDHTATPSCTDPEGAILAVTGLAQR